jgi:YD repeat-containing protein
MKRTPLFIIIAFTLLALTVMPSAKMEVKSTLRPSLKTATPVAFEAAPLTAPTVTITSPFNNAQFIAGATIRLSANASDSDGTISKVEFYQGAVKLATITSSPYNYDWTNVTAGSYVLTAVATDNQSQVTTSTAVNISVLAQSKQFVGWSSLTNGTDLGNGSVRKTSTGAWDFSATALQTLQPGDGYFESTAANFNQSISLNGANGQSRAIVVGSGGWVGIYEGSTEVAGTFGHIPSETITAHGAGDRYRIEITNSVLRYIRYRGATREVMFQSTAPLPTYPMTGALGMSPQNAEWQKTVLGQLTRKATWVAIANGVDTGNGTVQKTSTGTWDFSATAAQTLARGDGYFESTASYWNHSISVSGTDGAGRALIVGTGGWAAIYENGVEVANTSPLGNISAHGAGDRYRLEISNNTLRYVRYRGGIRSVIYTSANSLPAYPLSFSLGMSFQGSEWQNSVFAQLSTTVTWTSISNGIDLGNGSVRKTSTGTWDFSAGARQQLVGGPGYLESTASYWNHSINLGSSDGQGRSFVAGTGGWAAIYENNTEVASTSPLGNLGAYAAGDRYRLELIGGKLRYVRYRSGVRSIAYTSANAVPAYALGFSVGMSFQNSEWQNTMFSDNVPEHNDASFVSQTVPATMVPGQNYSVSVTMRNTGASTWTPDGDYQLGSENLSDNTRWGLSRVNLTTIVPPGSDATFNFTVTAPAAGSHSFQWRMVQQGVQRFGALSTNVNVQTVNNPPTVTLTSPAQDAVFTAPATVAFAATASDSDGSITKVEFFQGSTKVGEDTTSPYTFNWTNVSAGTYVLTARATDNGGATANSSAVNITVNPPNQPPTVNLIAPINNDVFSAPANITLTANATDSDGIVTKVQFFQGATMINEDTAAPFTFNWTNVSAANYNLTAKAFDNAGATATSTIVAIIVNALPSVSLTAPSSGQVFTAPANITLTATASDSDGSISKVQFFQGTTLLNEDLTAPYSFNWTSVGSGNYNLTAKAIDNRGGVGTSAVIPITVNTLPTVTITSPPNPTTLVAPANVAITAAASDPDGSITKIEFFVGSVLLGQDTTVPYTFNYNNLTSGVYVLTAKATDNLGGVTTSSPVTVIVTNAPTTSITSPANNAAFTTGSNIVINALASDSDGTVAKVEFLKDGVVLGEDTTPPYSFTWNNVATGNYAITTRATDDLGVTGTSSTTNISVIVPTAIARLDPANRTGGGSEDPLSRNYNWSAPLINLPGRAGLDLGLSLSYNSLVWTRTGNYVTFDDDAGFPSPGFRLGFPTIQGPFVNSQAGKNAYLLIAADGSRLELRQVNTSNFYETVDSSHMLLNSSTMVLQTVNGMQLSYVQYGTNFQCVRVQDRNGNFITINRDSNGRITTIVDTLGRTITFNYESNALTTITQSWAGGTHVWASFTYTETEVQTGFSVSKIGFANGDRVKTLRGVWLNDGSHFEFDYTSWVQVSKINKYAADGHPLNYRSYNLPTGVTPQRDDCPRFSERRDWAENFNRGGSPGSTGLPSGPEEEVVTATWLDPANASWTLPNGSGESGVMVQMTQPDGTYDKLYLATSAGWKRGLLSMVETYGKTTPDQPSPSLQRRKANLWTQDDEGASVLTNPRVKETHVYDFDSSSQVKNHTRTRIEYTAVAFGNGTSCSLPSDVFEYQADADHFLRRTQTDYQTPSGAYIVNHVVGLPTERRMYEVNPDNSQTLMSKVGFAYDESGSILDENVTVQHDPNYDLDFEGRGNLSTVTRYDVVTGQSTVITTKYNFAGSTRTTTDPLGHQVSIGYADSFSDNANHNNTFGYATSITDSDSFTSTSQFNYDFGLMTRMQTPAPAGQTTGPIKNFTYDSKARVEKVAVEITTNTDYSYMRFEYPDSQNRVDTFTTIEAGKGEAQAYKLFDGHGRVIANVSAISTGVFTAQLTLFDKLGRPIKQSNPTQTSASGAVSQWAATGDDDTNNGGSGWAYTSHVYDWNSRLLTITNTAGKSKTATYDGCGCAGSDVMTMTDEVGRRQKVYSDVLGRQWKTEILNPDGTVYSTTTATFNARDQATLIRQWEGVENGSGVHQDTTQSYDGFGRLQSKHVPQQDANTFTTWTYNADDTLHSVTDARGASATYTYNNGRHLPTLIQYTAPTGISATGDVSYEYDGARNRTSMGDEMGTVTYTYDKLSRVTSEMRTFSGVGSFTLGYDYNLAGQVTSITDPTNSTIDYDFDKLGRLDSITGSNNLYANVQTYASGFTYRASGGIKGLTFGNNFTMSASYDSVLRPTSFKVTAPGGQADIIKNDYTYYDDGKPKYLHDWLDERFDRAYGYDHRALLKQAFSGSEARDLVNNTTTPGATGPYWQLYQFDAFGHMTRRDNRFWSQSDVYTASYANNRRTETGYHYDADGNLIQDPDVIYGYDAVGNNVALNNPAQNLIYTTYFDGDRQMVKKVQTSSGNTVSTTYYLRSSVLGGRVITELNEQGQKQVGYVFAGNEVLARQQGGSVAWQHRDLWTGSRVESYANGAFNPINQLDPMGVDVGFSDPFIFCCDPPPISPDIRTPFLMDGFGIPDGRCVLDGIAIDCGFASQLMNSGAAVQCPNNDCGPRTVTVTITYTSGRQESQSGLTNPFSAYADGRSGFMFGGMLIPPGGLNVTFTGLAAQNAAAAYHAGLANGAGFASAAAAGYQAGQTTQVLLDVMKEQALESLDEFLKKNPHCAEALQRVVQHPEDWTYISIPNNPWVLDRTMSEIGSTGDQTVRTVLKYSGAAADTVADAKTIFFTALFFGMSPDQWGMVVFHELAFHGNGLDHVDAAYFFGLTGWEPPKPPVNVSPYASQSIRESATRARDQAWKRSNETQTAAFGALQDWIKRGCQ